MVLATASMARQFMGDMVGGGAFTVNASTISGHVGESGIAVIYNAYSHRADSWRLFLNPADGTAFSDESLTADCYFP